MHEKYKRVTMEEARTIALQILLNAERERLEAAQVELDSDSKKVLYENLWDLYL